MSSARSVPFHHHSAPYKGPFEEGQSILPRDQYCPHCFFHRHLCFCPSYCEMPVFPHQRYSPLLFSVKLSVMVLFCQWNSELFICPLQLNYLFVHNFCSQLACFHVAHTHILFESHCNGFAKRCTHHVTWQWEMKLCVLPFELFTRRVFHQFLN